MTSKRRNTSDFDEHSDSGLSSFSDIFSSKKSKATTNSSDDESNDDGSLYFNDPKSRAIECLQCQPYKVKCYQYSIASLERAPTKRASQFQIELHLRNYSTNLERKDIFDKLIADHQGITCIVSLEENDSHRTKYRSAKKYKIFLNTKYTQKRNWSSEELYFYIYHMLRGFVGDEQEISEEDLATSNSTMDNDKRPEIILKKSSSIPESIRWATIDFEPRYTNNFDPSTFSESYRIEKWASDNIDKPFSLDMPFVREGCCRKSRADLKAYFEEHKAKHHKRHVNKPLEIGPFNDWRDEVAKWWNSWCKPNAWYPKKPQMLIIGPQSNTGKTMFVTQALFRGADPKNEIPREAILIPERSGNTRTVSTFAWQKAKPAYHSVIYCDEFEIGYYNTETLKIVLEGSFFNPQIKMKCSGDDIQLAIPAIFISNTEIPEFDSHGKDMKPFLKRFKIVRIPNSAKKYRSNDFNPYIEMFEEQLLIEKLKEHERRENEKLLANLIDLEAFIVNELEQEKQKELEQERTALEIVEQNEKRKLHDNELANWICEHENQCSSNNQQFDTSFNYFLNFEQQNNNLLTTQTVYHYGTVYDNDQSRQINTPPPIFNFQVEPFTTDYPSLLDDPHQSSPSQFIQPQIDIQGESITTCCQNILNLDLSSTSHIIQPPQIESVQVESNAVDSQSTSQLIQPPQIESNQVETNTKESQSTSQLIQPPQIESNHAESITIDSQSTTQLIQPPQIESVQIESNTIDSQSTSQLIQPPQIESNHAESITIDSQSTSQLIQPPQIESNQGELHKSL